MPFTKELRFVVSHSSEDSPPNAKDLYNAGSYGLIKDDWIPHFLHGP